nr:MAG TPA: hypothetical protein [Bacteriophage sp.]
MTQVLGHSLIRLKRNSQINSIVMLIIEKTETILMLY